MTVTLKFDRDRSYFPLAGKLSDKFNGRLKLVIIAEVSEPQTADIGLAILWKGTPYNMGHIVINFEEAGTYEIVASWGEVEPPTLAEFIQQFGEELPKETTEYPYSWLVGTLDGSQLTVHDKWDTSLLVEVPPFPWEIVLPVAGLAVAGLGLAIVMGRK